MSNGHERAKKEPMAGFSACPYKNFALIFAKCLSRMRQPTSSAESGKKSRKNIVRNSALSADSALECGDFEPRLHQPHSLCRGQRLLCVGRGFLLIWNFQTSHTNLIRCRPVGAILEMALDSTPAVKTERYAPDLGEAFSSGERRDGPLPRSPESGRWTARPNAVLVETTGHRQCRFLRFLLDFRSVVTEYPGNYSHWYEFAASTGTQARHPTSEPTSIRPASDLRNEPNVLYTTRILAFC